MNDEEAARAELARMGKWLIPQRPRDWVACAIYSAVLVPLLVIGLNFWLALLCAFAAQVAYYLTLRLVWGKL